MVSEKSVYVVDRCVAVRSPGLVRPVYQGAGNQQTKGAIRLFSDRRSSGTAISGEPWHGFRHAAESKGIHTVRRRNLYAGAVVFPAKDARER